MVTEILSKSAKKIFLEEVTDILIISGVWIFFKHVFYFILLFSEL